MADAKADITTPLIHLYRGELGRMTMYRVRLDTTTNWAVGTTAAVLSFALSTKSVPHAVFGVPLCLNLLFLWMEGRRFQIYELIRLRVRLLERGFYGGMLGGTEPDDWREQLAASLEDPKIPVTMLRALSVRLRRNYLWLLAVTYASWGLKVRAIGGLKHANIGSVPGFVVAIIVAATLVPLCALAFLHRPNEHG